MPPSLPRACLAEFLGTAGLLAIVVGSGIMAQRTCAGHEGLALLANTLATGAGLLALIACFGGASGAHFNPMVSAMQAVHGRMGWPRAAAYMLAQVLGAAAGVILAHAMFELPLVQDSGAARSGTGLWLSEGVATLGLLLVIHGTARHAPALIPAAVPAFVVAGYWFTASTCFANPAVTIARGLTGTFAGIAPGDVPGFVLAQAAGLALALVLIRILTPPEPAGR